MADHPTPDQDLPIQTSTNGAGPLSSPPPSAGGSTAPADAPRGPKLSDSRTPAAAAHVHQPSGYAWSRDEDAPGYSWKNRKAQEEMARGMEMIVERERIVGRKYGDIGSEDFAQSG